MTVSYLGSVTLGQALPIAVSAQAQLSIALDSALAELTGKLEGALNVAASLLAPPALTATITATLQVLASMQLDVGASGGVLQLTAVLALLAEVELQLVALDAAVDLSAALIAQLAVAGIHLYTFSGPANTFGPELTAATAAGFPGGGLSDNANAVVLATSSTSAWAAMQASIKTA